MSGSSIDNIIEKKKRNPSKPVWGNRFYFIPLSATSNKIVLKDICVVTVSPSLVAAINYINKLYIDGFLKKDANSKGIEISTFTYTLHNLYYPVFKANSNFTSNDGDWLYLMSDHDIDIKTLKYQFVDWCEKRLLKNEFALLKNEIEKSNSITLNRKNIEILLDPHMLDDKSSYFLYNLLPSYLSYQLNGKVNVEVPSSDGSKFSRHDFYRLQDKDNSSSMISLPFKTIRDKYMWTYSLDIEIKSVKEINHPFVRLGLRTSRFLKYLPSFFNDRNFNTIVSCRTQNGSINAYKLNARLNDEDKKWRWRYDFSKGLRSHAFEILNAVPEGFEKGNMIDVPKPGIEVGIVCDTTMASDENHPVGTGASDFDESEIFNETLRALREIEKNDKANIHYGDYLELEDMAKEETKKSAKSSDRFSRLDDETTIDVYYSSDDFLKYLQDAIEIAFLGKRERDRDIVVMDQMRLLNANSVKTNDNRTEYAICLKDKQAIMSINPIKIDEPRSFLIREYELEQYKELKEKIGKYIPIRDTPYRPAIFEIEGQTHFFDNAGKKHYIDPKSIIRNVLAENGAVSQFIAFQDEPYIDIDYIKDDKESSKKYHDNVIPYINAFKDLMRQIGIPGKISNSYPGDPSPVIVGLWFMNNQKSKFKFSSNEDFLPRKLIYPIIVSMVEGNVYMAVFTNETYGEYRRKGKNFGIEWLSYPKGLLQYTKVMTAYHELNQSYSQGIMKTFIYNALTSLGDAFKDREIIIYTNAQKARHCLEDFRANVVTDKDVGFDSENEWLAHKDRTTIIRIVDDECGETPEYIHLSPEKTPVFGTHRKGVFKLTENTYYLINPQSESTKKAKEPKEFTYNTTLTEPTVLEVSVYGYMPNPVWDYIMLTRELRSASSTVSTHTAIKHPLPIHMAKTAEEYIVAYYDEYFIKCNLEKKALKKQRKPLD